MTLPTPDHCPQTTVAIVGGGLAGLALAILLGREGVPTTVLEQADYPRHKVCGEYVSRESLPFLERLGIPLNEYALPFIDRFTLTTPYGWQASCRLRPGGLGISRFLLDDLLARQARSCGVLIRTNTRVQQIRRNPESGSFLLQTAQGEDLASRFVVGAYGRVSGLSSAGRSPAPKFFGVKYHVCDGPPDNHIEIHHFPGGYCGISRIEADRFCLCYLATADRLRPFRGDIPAFEANVLATNPFLRRRLAAPRVMDGVRTAHLRFGIPDPTQTPYPVLGDAAGFIPPITGNGMSLAFRSAHALFPALMQSLEQPSGADLALSANHTYIHRYLDHRIRRGVFLQQLLLHPNRPLNRLISYGLTHLPVLSFMTRQATGDTFR
jgi:2-polyprenyl-6-methoxyphenol hydroxylase-like FAD-dependent oxidoreductase